MDQYRPNNNPEAGKPRHLPDTMTPEVSAELMALLDTPLQGTYVEIGPATQPYLLQPLGNPPAARVFDQPSARYVGIDGGNSYYGINQFAEITGWGATMKGPSGRLEMRNSSSRLVETDATRFYANVQRELHEAGHSSTQMIIGDAQQPLFANGSVREVYAGNVMLTPGMHVNSILRIVRATRQVLEDDGLFIIAEDTMRDAERLIEQLRLGGFGEVYVLDGFQSDNVTARLRAQFGIADLQSIFIARGRVNEQTPEQTFEPSPEPVRRGIGRRTLDWLGRA